MLWRSGQALALQPEPRNVRRGATHPLRRGPLAAHFHAMNDQPRDAKPIAPSLEDALRRARIEAAEQAGASSTSREVDLARLDMLEDAVRPVIEQAPREANLFDFGKSYGDQPRLFLDMIAFIELAEDHRTYRFFQDTRYGRILIAESARIETIVAAVTNYVARRLIERERALASDWRSAAHAPQEAAITRPARTLPQEAARPSKIRNAWGARLLKLLGDTINGFFVVVGTLVLVGLVLVGAYYGWIQWGRAFWFAHFGGAS